MDELEKARKEIDAIDSEMASLFERRMKAAEVIAAYKRERGLSVKDPVREAALIEKCRSYIDDETIESYYVEHLENMIDLSCRYQSRLIDGMRIAYCGVEGAFAHIAAKRMFPEGELVSCPDFADAYHSVEDGAFDCAVLPLENSYAGEVGAVMDLIFSGSLFVNQVVDLSIRQNVVAKKGTAREQIKTVVSHPQALQQCAGYIRKMGLETQTCSNTAVAAKLVQDSDDPTIAAIASEETAELYDLEIIDSGINDNQNNTTRFAALSRVQNKPSSGKVREDEAFILVFTVQNKAGALAQTLNIIGAHGFNMRSLRSRPMKDLQWNYYFYIEAEGNINNANGRDMLRELSAICARLKLVGTFFTDNE